MGFHSFSLDPRTILGVSSTASMDEIHEAYRAKTKKHHPDLGGDDWAFRMVTRAYEVLKATAARPALKPWENPGADFAASQRESGWDWNRAASHEGSNGPRSSRNGSDAANHRENPDAGSRDEPFLDPETAQARNAPADLEEFRIVDVALIWTRFEPNGVTEVCSSSEENERTLSVCLVLSWPAPHLVARAAELESAGDVLRALIELFERLHGSPSVVAARSRIEDGRFVGWLSYPNVLTAQDAFLVLRDDAAFTRFDGQASNGRPANSLRLAKCASGTGPVAGKLSPAIRHLRLPNRPPASCRWPVTAALGDCLSRALIG